MVTLQSVMVTLKDTPVAIPDLRKLVPPYCKVVKLEDIHDKHRAELFKTGNVGVDWNDGNSTETIPLIPS